MKPALHLTLLVAGRRWAPVFVVIFFVPRVRVTASPWNSCPSLGIAITMPCDNRSFQDQARLQLSWCRVHIMPFVTVKPRFLGCFAKTRPTVTAACLVKCRRSRQRTAGIMGLHRSCLLDCPGAFYWYMPVWIGEVYTSSTYAGRPACRAVG